MKRQNEALEFYKSVRKNNDDLIAKENKIIEDRKNKNEQFMNEYYIKKSMRERRERNHGVLIENARNNAFSTIIKAIYMTALDPRTLTDEAILLGESMVDTWIKENGGASKILGKIGNNSYLLSRITQIVDEVAEEEVAEIEKEEDTDAEEAPAETNKDAAVAAAKEFIDNADKDELKNFSKEVKDAVEDRKDEIKDEKKAEDAEKEAEKAHEKADKADEKAEKAKEKLEDKKEEESEDAAEEVPAPEEEADAKEEESEDKEEEKSEESEEPKEEKEDEEKSEDDSEEKKEEESEDKEEDKEEEKSEDDDDDDKEDESDDDSDPLSDNMLDDLEDEADDDDDKSEESEDKEENESNEEESDDKEEEKSEEDSEEEKDDESEDKEEDKEEDEEKSEDSEDMEDIEVDVDDDDGDGIDDDEDITVDGESDEESDSNGKVFDELDKEDDVHKAIELIRSRIADAEKTFIKNNAEDKKKVDDLLSKIASNVKTVEDLNDKDSKESKIAEESARISKRKIDQIRENRSLTVLEAMARRFSKSLIKDEKAVQTYLDESGTVDTELVVESAKVMYGFLETINTLNLDKVDENYIKNIIDNM